MAKLTTISFFSVLLMACGSGPQKIDIGHDQCDFCRMTIMEENFAGETITPKGKVFKYDDLKCLIMDRNARSKKLNGATFYIANYLNGPEFIPLSKAILVEAPALKSPMAGNVAAVNTREEAEKLVREKEGEIVALADVQY